MIKKVCFHRALHKLLALVSLISGSAMPVCAQTPLKREIIVGSNFDSFNFAGPAQALSLAYRADINPQFTLELDGYGYSRFGSGAGRGGLSLTYSPTRRTSATVGGSAGPSNPVAARGESFAEINHGIDVSEKGLIRGVEVDYRQGWLWFQNSQVAVFSPGVIFYMPGDCMLLVRVHQSRTDWKSLQSANWTTGASARLIVPLSAHLTGDVFYANGAENLTFADQVGRFSGRTNGGGARYRIGPHEIGTHIYYQNRTLGQTQTTVSLGYAYRF